MTEQSHQVASKYARRRCRGPRGPEACTLRDRLDASYGAHAEAWAYIVPDVYPDEEHLENYPFFLQALEGGVPVLARAHLTGSLSARRVLRGSLNRTSA